MLKISHRIQFLYLEDFNLKELDFNLEKSKCQSEMFFDFFE